MTSAYRAKLSAQAIDAHDGQKDFSDAFWVRLVDRIGELLPPGATVVDAGVGTGLVAARLAAAGFDVIGFDFNRSMLDALQARAGNSVCGVLADISRLPIPASTADAVMITNVLHLVTDWRAVLAEAARTLRDGGVLLVGLGGAVRSPVVSAVHRYFRDLVPMDADAMMGPRAVDEFVEEVAALGFDTRAPLVETDTVVRTIRTMVERLQHNVFTWPADTQPSRLGVAASRTKAWAEDELGSIDAEYEVEVDLTMHVAVRR